MTTIKRAKFSDIHLLAEIGKLSFIESHGSSAAPEEIKSYVENKYTPEVFKIELKNSKNSYHLIYQNGKLAGFSNIVLDAMAESFQIKNVTRLDRLYLLKEFYGLNLGYELLKFNIELSKINNQSGMWLYVWKENNRAVRFYILK